MAGNVAEHAIAKSGSRYGGAGERDRGNADELPVGRGGGAADRKSDTPNDLPPLTEVAFASLNASPNWSVRGPREARRNLVIHFIAVAQDQDSFDPF